jgi:hypothetical protein
MTDLSDVADGDPDAWKSGDQLSLAEDNSTYWRGVLVCLLDMRHNRSEAVRTSALLAAPSDSLQASQMVVSAQKVTQAHCILGDDKIGFAEAAHATRIQVEYLCVRGKEARGE